MSTSPTAGAAPVLDATLQMIGCGGLAAMSQRAVAAEARLPSSAVPYFDSVDVLLVATLPEVNDRYLAALTDVRTAPQGSFSWPPTDVPDD
jgi:DNA-binding transcriptional regulator YbjK